MKLVWQFLKKHPVAIIAVVLYTILCVRTLKLHFWLQDNLRQDTGLSGVEAGGEVVGLSDLFLVLVGGVIFLVNACWIIARPKRYKFYVLLLLAITFETYAVFYISSRFDVGIPPRHFAPDN
jgi:hypothetical protein